MKKGRRKVDLSEGLWIVRKLIDDGDCLIGNPALQREALVRRKDQEGDHGDQERSRKKLGSSHERGFRGREREKKICL